MQDNHSLLRNIVQHYAGSNQKYKKILKHDWLSLAQLGHWEDSICINACVIQQYASCACAVIVHFPMLTIFFLWNVRSMAGLFLKFCNSFDLLLMQLCVVQFCL